MFNIRDAARTLQPVTICSGSQRIGLRVQREAVIFIQVDSQIVIYPSGFPTATNVDHYSSLMKLAIDMGVNIPSEISVKLIVGVTLRLKGTYFEKETAAGEIDSCHIDNPYLVDWLTGTRNGMGELLAA